MLEIQTRVLCGYKKEVLCIAINQELNSQHKNCSWQLLLGGLQLHYHSSFMIHKKRSFYHKKQHDCMRCLAEAVQVSQVLGVS